MTIPNCFNNRAPTRYCYLLILDMRRIHRIKSLRTFVKCMS